MLVDGVEELIHFTDGDQNINLAPISGYSLLKQTLSLTRMSDQWYVTSTIKPCYNSTTNRVYDETPPVISMILVEGSAVINHEINTTFTDPGATANDDVEGDLTGSIVAVSTVDDAVLGAYTVAYTVSDSEGNESVAVRVVNVIDSTNPVITLVGDSELSIVVGTPYTEEGANVSDNSGETLSVTIGVNIILSF